MCKVDQNKKRNWGKDFDGFFLQFWAFFSTTHFTITARVAMGCLMGALCVCFEMLESFVMWRRSLDVSMGHVLSASMRLIEAEWLRYLNPCCHSFLFLAARSTEKMIWKPVTTRCGKWDCRSLQMVDTTGRGRTHKSQSVGFLRHFSGRFYRRQSHSQYACNWDEAE